MDFKQWLIKESVPPEFVSGGQVALWRYSHGDRGDEYVIDPAETEPQSYSRRDYMLSKKPRTFFYLDPSQKESLVGDYLYVTQHPAERIYNLLKDPEDLKEKARITSAENIDFDELFNLVEKAGYDGVYYRPHGRHIVNLFVPVTAKRAGNRK
jgi:hypothetical protein